LARQSEPTSHFKLSHHSTPIAPKWSATSPNDVLWADWGADFVAYHRPSGKTHLLNAASQLLITRVLSTPRTTSEVVAELASLQSRPIDTAYSESIDILMGRLEQLGLVERV